MINQITWFVELVGQSTEVTCQLPEDKPHSTQEYKPD